MEKVDCPGFIVLVKEAVDMWNMRVPAYCLMTNDYHLLIQTPDANLSGCMRYINGVYTQCFNRCHQREGRYFEDGTNRFWWMQAVMSWNWSDTSTEILWKLEWSTDWISIAFKKKFWNYHLGSRSMKKHVGPK